MNDDKKKSIKKPSSKKDVVEINPNVDIDQKMKIESSDRLDEVLSVMGRIKLARSMKKLAKSGVLERGKRKKELQSMTMKRATGLGWRGARRQIKQLMARGRSIQDLSPAEKSRIERVLSKRRERIMQLARKLTRAKLKESDQINEAFELMLEGNRRWHQLLNKDGTVKFDCRFKIFKSAPEVNMSDKDVVDTVDNISSALSTAPAITNEHLAVIVYNKLLESNSDRSKLEHAISVGKVFNVDHNLLLDSQ